MHPTIVLPPPSPGKNPPPAAGVAQGPGFRLLDPSTWKGAPAANAGGPTNAADVGAKKPGNDAVQTPTDAGSKTPGAVAKVPTTPAQPGDWRESWGKIDSPKSSSVKPDVPATPSAGAETPARPTPTVAALAATPLSPPTAAGPAHPTVAPPKPPSPTGPPPAAAAAPTPGPNAPSAVVATPAKPSVAPTTASPAAQPTAAPPASAVVARPDVPPTVAKLPPVPGPDTVDLPHAQPKAVSPPIAQLPPVPGTNPVDLPHAQPKADDPLADPQKYVRIPHSEDTFGKTGPTAKAAVPLGMKSALAAGATSATSGPEAAMGIDPNAPNAFSEPKGKSPGAVNAFTDPPPPPPPPPHPPQGIDLASNAFARDDQPQPLGAPAPGMAAPRPMDSALPTRMLPPPMYPAPATLPSGSLSTPRPASPVVPAGYRPGNPYDLTPLVAVLHESLYPSQREDAAEQLGALDWRQQPEILDILVERAKQDPAPTVRAECVRSLNRLKANTVPVVEAVKTLEADDDPRVRHEADEAYAALTGTTPKSSAPADASSAP